MKRSVLCLVGGSMVALLAAVLPPLLDGTLSAARSETFDARWAIPASTAKQNRLTAPAPNGNMQVIPSVDMQRGLTTLEKVEVAATRSAPAPKSPENTVRKEKLPIGCDPFFSPVTVPSMAHISGRCLAAAETGRKYAELSEDSVFR
jgi:hypothetical protein